MDTEIFHHILEKFSSARDSERANDLINRPIVWQASQHNVPGTLVPKATKEMAVTASLRPMVHPK